MHSSPGTSSTRKTPEFERNFSKSWCLGPKGLWAFMRLLLSHTIYLSSYTSLCWSQLTFRYIYSLGTDCILGWYSCKHVSAVKLQRTCGCYSMYIVALIIPRNSHGSRGCCKGTLIFIPPKIISLTCGFTCPSQRGLLIRAMEYVVREQYTVYFSANYN